MIKVLRFVTPLNFVGKRLDQFILHSMQGNHSITRSQIQKWIKSGCVKINQETILKNGHLLELNDSIEFTQPEIKKMDLEPTNLSIEVLYEDDDLAIIYKPSGISVHPSKTENETTLVHGLLYQLKNLSSIGGVERPGIVHRIDKGTSGIIVVSKNDFTHAGLSEQFKSHSINRKYKTLVLCTKNNFPKSGTIKTHFGRNPKHRKRMTGKLSKGRIAITHWKALESFKISKINFILIECSLETGRTHQIRVHLSEAGFPILGDPTYGNFRAELRAIQSKYPNLYHEVSSLKHQLLHAYKLGIIHPRTKKSIELTKELPNEFQNILNILKKSNSNY